MPDEKHKITYTYRGYRCRWICSCGAADKTYTVKKFFAAEQAGLKHLEDMKELAECTI